MMRLDHLPNQRPDEHVVLFMRRHWFAILTIVAAFVLLTGLPLGLGWYFWLDIEPWVNGPVSGPIIVVFGSLYVLSVWLFAFIEFTDFYLDTWIVTNERIINIEQEGLFHRTASELDLAAVARHHRRNPRRAPNSLHLRTSLRPDSWRARTIPLQKYR